MNLQTKVPAPASRALPVSQRSRRVTAVLGPTNTGKTHLAIERMLGHSSGIIGLPLRLLAREVYNRVVEKAGSEHVALITGEEKIKPKAPRYWIATVEAMPRDLDVAFVAIDEIQLCADLDRGHVFTDRLLNRRGIEETMLIGAATIRPLIERLLPGVTVITRPRLSNLDFAGERKLSRLPRRSAIVAFSAEEVYAIAEWIRRQRGGAAVVLGALSPRSRNAQVAMYQEGDVDYIIATDAIGMGLNLDVDHIAFAGDRKFDGWQYRRLNPAEMGQIAGRAGRHVRDGTFGTTGRCPPFEPELVEALVEHRFDALNVLQWRNSNLDFSSIRDLQASLDMEPGERGLTRAPLAEDVMVLDIAAREEFVQRNAKTRADIARLWDVCQVPDYRKVSPSAHADFVLSLFRHVVRAGRIPDDWFSGQLAALARADGDIDALSARIAQVRTFNYIANRPDWLNDPEHWQGVTRQVEDSLSDALHERLAHRFVDRRTSVLMRRLRENAMLEAEITGTGDVLVEGQHVGQLHGFRFTPDPQAEGEAQRTLNAAAQKALASEIENRANRVSNAVDDAFVLSNDGTIRWLGEPVGKLASGEHILKPQVRIVADEQLTGAALDMVQRRLELWVAQHITKLLGPLEQLEAGEGLEGISRGVAFQVAEALGVLERQRVAQDLKGLDQTARGSLRKLGVRFGAYHIYLPQLIKPAPRSLAAQLWALKQTGEVTGLDEVAHLAASGRTSFEADKSIDPGLYLAAGFRVCGERAVRVDILERLADLIRPAIAYRPGVTPGEPPPGAADRDGFVVTVAMTSLAGCSGDAFASILRSLGYLSETRSGPAITVPLVEAAPTQPIAQPIAQPITQPTAESAAPADVAAVPDGEVAEAAAPTEAAGGGAETVAGEASPATEPPAAEAEAADAAQEAAVDAPASAPEQPAEESVPPEVVATEMAAAEAAVADSSVVLQDAPVSAAVADVFADLPDDMSMVLSDNPASPASPAPQIAGDGLTAAVNEAVADAPVEDETITIWRPRRNQPGGRKGRPDRGGRQTRGRGPQHGGSEQAEGRSGEAAEGPQHGRPPRKGGGGKGGGKPGGRDDRRGRGKPGRHGSKPQEFSSAPQSKRPREPDPDSPFAKLAALKQQLEKKD